MAEQLEMLRKKYIEICTELKIVYNIEVMVI